MDPLRIITITTSCNFERHIDLDTVFRNHLYDSIEKNESRYFVKEMRLGKSIKRLIDDLDDDAEEDVEVLRRGRKKKERKAFTNQITLLISDKNHKKRRINAKVFRNGQCEITGVVDDGDDTTNVISVIHDSVIGSCETSSKLIMNPAVIRLVNATFKVGYSIDREVLYDKVRGIAGMSSRYDPGIYHGVVVKKPLENQTAIFFATGSVLINAKSLDGIYDAYSWACRILGLETHETKVLETKMDVSDIVNLSAPCGKGVGVVDGVVVLEDGDRDEDPAGEKVDIVLPVNPNEGCLTFETDTKLDDLLLGLKLECHETSVAN